MKDIKEAQKTLLRLNKRLSSVEELVNEELQKKSEDFKIPVFFVTEFVVPYFSSVVGGSSNPLRTQEKTIVNGAETCYLTEVSYTWTPVGQLDRSFQPPTEIPRIDPAFEFRWNYRLASTQYRYLAHSNGVLFSSRRSLGYLDVANNLKLAKPLLFAAGDALTVEMEPTLINQSGSTDILAFFTFSGFRTGEMA